VDTILTGGMPGSQITLIAAAAAAIAVILDPPGSPAAPDSTKRVTHVGHPAPSREASRHAAWPRTSHRPRPPSGLEPARSTCGASTLSANARSSPPGRGVPELDDLHAITNTIGPTVCQK